MTVGKKNRGVLLVSSIVVALVMMMWVVAALISTKSQTSYVLQSHRKSKSYFLAKSGVSASLYRINSDATWTGTHNSKANGSTEIAGTTCWVETLATQKVLRCEADIDGQVSSLTVPLLETGDKDTEVLSVTTSADGHDMIAKNSVSAVGWEALPPLPGLPDIFSATGADNGDIYAVAESPEGGSTLWRYRPGRNWLQLPELPTGVDISTVSIAKDDRLIARGSDNSLQVLPLDGNLDWQSYAPPPGTTTLEKVVFSSVDSKFAYATTEGNDSSTRELWRYEFPDNYSETMAAGQWTSIPAPPKAAHFDSSGNATFSGAIPNYDGGIGAGPNGEVIVASNPPGEPSVLYKYTATDGWSVFPAVKFFQDGMTTDPPLVTSIKDLKVDGNGFIWMQAQTTGIDGYSNLRINPDD